MTAPSQPAGDEVLDVMAEVMEQQARVNRAEASLAGARVRLGASLDRLSRVAGQRGVEVPPLAAAVAKHTEGLPSPAEPNATPGERTATLRERLVTAMEANPGAVFTPARLARAIGHENRDSIRNTLLLLAAKGLVEKRGEGQYQARAPERAPTSPTD